MTEPIVSVRDLVKAFPVTRSGRKPAMLRAVNRISFDIAPETTLGLVGESGSGKSTTGRILVGLAQPTSGTVQLFGRETLNFARFDDCPDFIGDAALVGCFE